MEDGERSLLVLVGGVPGETDVCTSLFRLVDTALAAGHRVSVWACGWATGLTHSGLAATRPRDFADWDRVHPSTATLVRDLLARHPELLSWWACRYCAQERGTVGQIEGVQVVASQRVAHRVAEADVAVSMVSL